MVKNIKKKKITLCTTGIHREAIFSLQLLKSLTPGPTRATKTSKDTSLHPNNPQDGIPDQNVWTMVIFGHIHSPNLFPENWPVSRCNTIGLPQAAHFLPSSSFPFVQRVTSNFPQNKSEHRDKWTNRIPCSPPKKNERGHWLKSKIETPPVQSRVYRQKRRKRTQTTKGMYGRNLLFLFSNIHPLQYQGR